MLLRPSKRAAETRLNANSSRPCQPSQRAEVYLTSLSWRRATSLRVRRRLRKGEFHHVGFHVAVPRHRRARSICTGSMTSLDREPKKNAPLRAFEPARSTAFFVGVRVFGVGGRDGENAHAVRARWLRWGDGLRRLKRALLSATGAHALFAQAVCHRWTASQRRMPRSAPLSQAWPTAFFVGVRVFGVGDRGGENAHAVRARWFRWGGWLRLLKRALLARGPTNETVTAKSRRTPSEPAGFGGVMGFAGSSGLFWLAVQRTRPCTAKTRTPSEPAGFDGAVGFAGSSGLFWLAVQRTRPLRRKRARRQSPLVSVGRLASPAQAGSSGSRSNERGRGGENAHAVRARWFRWGGWLRLLKRALLSATGAHALFAQAVCHRWTASQRRMPRSAPLSRPGQRHSSSACAFSRLEAVMAKTATPSEPAGFGGAMGFAGSSGLFCPPPVRTLYLHRQYVIVGPRAKEECPAPRL